MTDEELRKLKRGDLLELLVAQERELESVKMRLEEAEKALTDRWIRLNEAGNIAQAALDVNGVFQAAQAAADQYLESIRQQSLDVEAHCTRLEMEAREKADRMVADAEAKCATMVAQAEAETREFWDMVSLRLENFYNEHAGLRELLALEQLKNPAPIPEEINEQAEN
jgi:cell division septum initiation protein DivIVA